MTNRHKCMFDFPGNAADVCTEYDDDTFWIDNGEYRTQVNYCPACGEKAPKQVEGMEVSEL